MQSYRLPQLSPARGFRSAMILSTPSALRRAARAAAAFPPPMTNTSVSSVFWSLRLRPGAGRRDSSSGCKSRLVNPVQRFQIFQDRTLFSSIGSSNILPQHCAPGDLVRKLRSQSINCYKVSLACSSPYSITLQWSIGCEPEMEWLGRIEEFPQA